MQKDKTGEEEGGMPTLAKVVSVRFQKDLVNCTSLAWKSLSSVAVRVLFRTFSDIAIVVLTARPMAVFACATNGISHTLRKYICVCSEYFRIAKHDRKCSEARSEFKQRDSEREGRLGGTKINDEREFSLFSRCGPAFFAQV